MVSTRKGKPGGFLVYSTETGRMCPECGQPVASCACREVKSMPASDGIVRVSLDTKGRRGKGVTVVKGVSLDAVALADLGKQLKTACGSGGTVKDGIIEVQGDHRELIVERLTKRGWVVKRAGG